MKEDEPDLYAHLISLGVTKRAAGAIGADLNDLNEGIAEIEAKLLSIKGSLADLPLMHAQQEIEFHLRGHLRSLNREIKRLRKKASRKTARRSSSRDIHQR